MTHRFQLAWIVVVLGTVSFMLSFPAACRAKPKQARTAVLPLKVKGLPVQEARSMGKTVAKTMVAELKKMHFFRLVAGKSISKKLNRLKKKKILVKACHADSKCIRSVGRRLRVKVLFSMHLTKVEDGVSVLIRALDVRSGKQIREAEEISTGQEDDLVRATRWALLKASSPVMTSLLKGKGRLEVACAQSDADLLLNGKSFGKMTNKSFKVGTGVFDVKVKKAGFKPFHDVVAVKPDQKVKVDVVLQSLGPKKVPVIATAPVEPKKTVKKKTELPAWAVFEKKTDTKPSKTTFTSRTESKAEPQTPPKPFLPAEKETMDTPVEKIDDDHEHWYGTWWFWTAVGVVAAGGLTGGLYAAGVFEGSSSGATGSAAISWQ